MEFYSEKAKSLKIFAFNNNQISKLYATLYFYPEYQSEFFYEYKEERILFIFTKVHSVKELRLRLGSHLDRKNVLIDKEQLYISAKEEINIYPIIIDIRDAANLEWRFLESGISYQSILETFGK